MESWGVGMVINTQFWMSYDLLKSGAQEEDLVVGGQYETRFRRCQVCLKSLGKCISERPNETKV